MGRARRAAGLPRPPPGEGRGEGSAPQSPAPSEKVDTALTLPSPGGRGLNSESSPGGRGLNSGSSPAGRGFDSVLAGEMDALGAAARAAARQLATATSDSKITALREAAVAIRAAKNDILAANPRDLDAAQKRSLSAALLDRLALDASRIEAVARRLEDIAALPEPIGRVLAAWTQPNGLHFQRRSVALGVIRI